MQATTNNNNKPRRIYKSDGRHEETTETEGPGTENCPRKLFIILDDQALFFPEEFLGEEGEGGRERWGMGEMRT